jgi:predicted peroxiredoxin
MKLGIHVNTDKHIEHVIGIAKAAAAKGHEVSVFTMADGERLLEDSRYSELCRIANIKMSYCDHNASHMGIKKELLPEEITCGSQYNNAVMVSEVDKVIVL